jgi:hypothetical protein
MLDLLGILFSSGIMILVILRAVQLDATTPWFRPARSGPDSSGLRLKPPAPGGGVTENRQARREKLPDR